MYWREKKKKERKRDRERRWRKYKWNNKLEFQYSTMITFKWFRTSNWRSWVWFSRKLKVQSKVGFSTLVCLYSFYALMSAPIFIFYFLSYGLIYKIRAKKFVNSSICLLFIKATQKKTKIKNNQMWSSEKKKICNFECSAMWLMFMNTEFFDWLL